jgi:hypothetical protein
MENLGHIMVDIETMDNRSNAAIVSIGAIEFDLNTGQTGRSFYTNVDLQSCLDAGLRVKGSTVIWWLQQNKQARLKLSESPIHLNVALLGFKSFISECGKDVQLWGNSARFDLGILTDAFVLALKEERPWNFRNERCVRTLVAFAPEVKETQEKIGVEHDALDDCRFQIAYCSKIWNSLTR